MGIQDPWAETQSPKIISPVQGLQGLEDEGEGAKAGRRSSTSNRS